MNQEGWYSERDKKNGNERNREKMHKSKKNNEIFQKR